MGSSSLTVSVSMVALGGIAAKLAGAKALVLAPTFSLDRVWRAAEALAARHPALRVEHKRGSIALHYRQAPDLEPICHAAMQEAVRSKAAPAPEPVPVTTLAGIPMSKEEVANAKQAMAELADPGVPPGGELLAVVLQPLVGPGGEEEREPGDHHDHRQRLVGRQAPGLVELAQRDVTGTGDMAGGVFLGLADIDHHRLLAVDQSNRLGGRHPPTLRPAGDGRPQQQPARDERHHGGNPVLDQEAQHGSGRCQRL